MSFIKSKHSGWTWDLKRTPFGGGGGGFIEDIGGGISDAFGGIVDSVDSALTGLDKTVGSAIPGGWATLGAGAAALATGGSSLFGSAALTAEAVATADGIALSTYGVPAAEAMASYGIPAAELGLPAAATAADIGAIAGTASAEFAGSELGQQAIAATAEAVSGGAKTATQLASQLGYSDPIAAIAGGVNPADLGMVQSGAGGLGDLLGYAKTGAQIVGGVGKLAGGIMSLQAGKQMGQYARQADPFAQYRPGYAAQLQNLMSNPQSVTQTPGYQFNLAQGLQGLQAQQAAQGRLVSGGALLQGQQFGQQLASQTYNQQLQTLAGLSGANQSPASGAAAQAGLTASNLGSTYGGWQSIAGGLGQVSNPLATLYSNYNNPSPNPSV
jgi:hypothetical protein